jgi:hypothetical protein
VKFEKMPDGRKKVSVVPGAPVAPAKTAQPAEPVAA